MKRIVDGLKNLFGWLLGREDQSRKEEYEAEPDRYRCVDCNAPYGSLHEDWCGRIRADGQFVVVSEDVEDKTPLDDQMAGSFPMDVGLWGSEIEKLAYRERQVLQWLYGAEPETYGKVASRFDITPQRVKLIADQAIKKLMSLSGEREHDPVLGPEVGGDRQSHGISQLPSADQDPAGKAESSE